MANKLLANGCKNDNHCAILTLQHVLEMHDYSDYDVNFLL